MSNSSTPASEGPQPTPAALASTRSALTRYRVMAYITGVMLLVLTVEMVLKYLVQVNGFGEEVIGNWVAFVHGWIYVVYLWTVYDVWSRARWSWGRLWIMVFGGVVPVLSFVVEKRTHRWLPDADESGDQEIGLNARSEEHTSELQSRGHLVCRLLL